MCIATYWLRGSRNVHPLFQYLRCGEQRSFIDLQVSTATKYMQITTPPVKLFSKQHVTFGSVLLINHLPICLLVVLLVVLLLPQLLPRKSSLSPSLGLLRRQMMSALPTFSSTIANSCVSGSIISVHRYIRENAIHLFANAVSYGCWCVVVSRRLRVTVMCGESC